VTESARPTAIVVGAGIAGLIGAVDLARAGVAVTLLEGGAQAGGRARTRQVGGFAMNQGPHALYRGGAFAKTLNRLGVPTPGRSPAFAQAQGMADGKLTRLPVSLDALARTRLFTLADKLGFARIQKRITGGARPEGSVGAWLDGQRLSPRLRQAVEAFVRLSSYSNAPRQTSAAAALDQMRLTYKGVSYIDGGWSTLVDGLVKACEAAGVVVRTGSAAEQVAPLADGFKVRLAGGEEMSADTVLLAMGPHEASGLAQGMASLRQAASDAIPIRMNALDLGLERMPERGAAFALGIDRPFYHSLHSDAGRLAPEGCALVHVARYLRSGEAPGPDAVIELERYADEVMPGWRPLERQRQRLIAMTVVHAVWRWDVARPGVAVAEAPGLFVAGDWVGGEGMLSDASAASALQAARQMMAHLTRRTRAAA